MQSLEPDIRRAIDEDERLEAGTVMFAASGSMPAGGMRADRPGRWIAAPLPRLIERLGSVLDPEAVRLLLAMPDGGPRQRDPMRREVDLGHGELEAGPLLEAADDDSWRTHSGRAIWSGIPSVSGGFVARVSFVSSQPVFGVRARTSRVPSRKSCRGRGHRKAVRQAAFPDVRGVIDPLPAGQPR